MTYLELISCASNLAISHTWLAREMTSQTMHPAIKAAFDLGYEAGDLQQLAMEWPHKPDMDDSMLRVAYTRNVEHGINDRQTVVSLSKYLTRHFPFAKADQIRDLAVLFTPALQEHCKFVENDIEEIVNVVMNGPQSCMKWTYVDLHPYLVYQPSLGWSMAVRVKNDSYWGRCLCLKHNDQKLFVRSYAGDPHLNSHSQSDTYLEAWLVNQGFEKASEWPEGARLAKVYSDSNSLIVPYLDGDNKVYERGSYLYISSDGDMELSCTNGEYEAVSGDDPDSYCECCRQYFYETYGAGYHEDTYVCSSCREEHYTYAHSHDNYECYISDSDVIGVTDSNNCATFYDIDCLDEYNIVKINSGSQRNKYAFKQDVIVDINDDTWHIKDINDEIVLIQTEESESYYPISEVFFCSGTNNFYPCSIEHVLDNEGKYFLTSWLSEKQACLHLEESTDESK